MELWIQETWDNTRYSLEVKETLFAEQSEFQQIEIVDTHAYGRVLVIDGLYMTSERDEHIYHEMIAHPALVTVSSPERVLLIGGGDGGTARQVLRHRTVEQVVMVEIDAMVIEACKQHLPALGAWDDPRLDVCIRDGIDFVKRSDAEPFDVILLDGTDPIGPGRGLFNMEFFRGVKRMLRPGGAFVMQSESPDFMYRVFMEIQASLGELFERVMPYFGPVPLYSSGAWSWTYATDSVDPRAVRLDRVAAIEPDCEYYNRDIHQAAFALPSYLARALRRGGQQRRPAAARGRGERPPAAAGGTRVAVSGGRPRRAAAASSSGER